MLSVHRAVHGIEIKGKKFENLCDRYYPIRILEWISEIEKHATMKETVGFQFI